MGDQNIIEPQPGFQTKVLSNSADVLIMGGSAGCGKTFCLLMEPLRYVHKPGFAGIILRREYVQIMLPDGLWDKSVELYSQLQSVVRPEMKVGNLKHVFPSGARLAFDHISTEQAVYRYMGPEFAYIAFDELTHFTMKQFFYMMTRNRSTSGVKPLIRAATNPQGEGWVKDLVQWYLYPDDYPDESLRGFPIPERSGVLRYFMQTGNNISDIVWGDSRQEVWEQLDEKFKQKLANVSDEQWAQMSIDEQIKFGEHVIKSFSFIFGLLRDNQILTTKDPTYVGNLLAQDETTVAQLFDGRWSNMNQDGNRLFVDEIIHDWFTNSFVSRPGIRYMTCDIALEGSDKFVVVIWDGWVVIAVYSYDKSDGFQVWNTIKSLALKWKIPGRNIAFDADGAGGFLKGFFKNSFSFNGNAAPMIEDGKPKDGRPRPNYENLRAQVHYKFRDMLTECETFIAVQDVLLQKTVIEEFKAIKKGETKSNEKLCLVPKSVIKIALKRSPDYVDAIVMRAVFDMKKPVKKEGRKLRSW